MKHARTYPTFHSADCRPLITSRVLIGISVKEIRAVKVAQSGTDTLQHGWSQLNGFTYALVTRSLYSQSASGGSQISFIVSQSGLHRTSQTKNKLFNIFLECFA